MPVTIITSKSGLKALTEMVKHDLTKSETDFIRSVHNHILKQKIRFPLLEFATKEIFNSIEQKEHFRLTDKIIELDEIGSYVIAGMVVQNHLKINNEEAIEKAIQYIIKGNKWYVCDIIGERVMGVCLLKTPEFMLPKLQEMAKNKNPWIVRCIGVAAHYAIKKGLEKQYVYQLFEILLHLGQETDFHIKKGIGWGAKTTAKFYPDIIADYGEQIESLTGQWFKTKIKIGLSRSFKYASRYSG